MDARAFRLSWPAGTRLFEVEQPDVLGLKQERLGDAVPTCTRTPVPVNLADDWPTALVGAGFEPGRPTAWLLEGLLPYLDAPLVGELLSRVSRLSATGSILLTDVIGRLLLDAPPLRPMVDFVRNLGAPWIFGTDAPEALLEPLGWEVTAHDLAIFAAEAGRWPWPVIPRSVPGVPRSFLVEARRP
jgi:methyltransferase (TIGR00027 family)